MAATRDLAGRVADASQRRAREVTPQHALGVALLVDADDADQLRRRARDDRVVAALLGQQGRLLQRRLRELRQADPALQQALPVQRLRDQGRVADRTRVADHRARELDPGVILAGLLERPQLGEPLLERA